MKILSVLLFLVFFVNPIRAVEITPESEEKTKDIVNIVKQIVNNNTSPTPPLSSQPKSFFGNITQMDDNTITINYKNKNQLVGINDETTYIDSKRNKSKFINFKIGQEILAMGYLNEDQSLDCKRIVATEMKSIANDNQTITGQIVDISKETSVFTLTPNYNKNNPFQIKTDSKTKFVDINNEKIVSTKAITNGNKVISIINPDAKLTQTFYASKIIVLDSPNDKVAQANPSPTPKP